jgi:hypothetical protein
MINALVVSSVKKLIDSIVTESLIILLLFIFLIIRVMHLRLLIFGLTSLSMIILN